MENENTTKNTTEAGTEVLRRMTTKDLEEFWAPVGEMYFQDRDQDEFWLHSRPEWESPEVIGIIGIRDSDSKSLNQVFLTKKDRARLTMALFDGELQMLMDPEQVKNLTNDLKELSALLSTARKERDEATARAEREREDRDRMARSLTRSYQEMNRLGREVVEAQEKLKEYEQEQVKFKEQEREQEREQEQTPGPVEQMASTLTIGLTMSIKEFEETIKKLAKNL